MKKYLLSCLSALLFVFMLGCGSSSSTPAAGQSSDPLDQYIGKYVCLEMRTASQDYTDFIQEKWADKSFYEYVEITPDSKFMFYIVDGDSVDTSEYYFDAEKHAIYEKQDRSDLSVLDFSDNNTRITVDLTDTYLVFEKTSELD